MMPTPDTLAAALANAVRVRDARLYDAIDEALARLEPFRGEGSNAADLAHELTCIKRRVRERKAA